MDLSEDIIQGNGNIIRAYQPGNIRVNNQSYEKSLVVTPKLIHPDWTPQQLDQLALQHIEFLATLDADLIILGVGETLVFPKNAILAPVYERNIGLEIMGTAAACRTYNLLMAEDRNVLAALIIA